jgi:hypothetical protein
MRAVLFSSKRRKDSEQALQWWLEALKTEAEKLAREEAARS